MNACRSKGEQTGAPLALAVDLVLRKRNMLQLDLNAQGDGDPANVLVRRPLSQT